MPREWLMASTRWRGVAIVLLLLMILSLSLNYHQIDMILSLDERAKNEIIRLDYQGGSTYASRRKGDFNATLLYHTIWKYPLAEVDVTTTTTTTTTTTEIMADASNKRAIALISMGPGALESTLVERCIISIRKRGQFLGPIFVLTDAPIQRYKSLTSQDVQLIVMHPRLEDWNWELHRDMPYKRFKTYLLEYLHRDVRLAPVHLVYYLDIDIVVGQPLLPWFHHVEHTYMEKHARNANQPSSALMVLFGGNISPLQGGQFLVQLGRSEGCLERWRYHMDANPIEHKDQPSLSIMWKQQQGAKMSPSANCTLLRMPQEPYLEFLSTKEMSQWIGDKKGIPYPTLMHIKNTQHASTIPDAMQKEFFQTLLELPSALVANITGRRRIRPNRTWSALQVKVELQTKNLAQQ